MPRWCSSSSRSSTTRIERVVRAQDGPGRIHQVGPHVFSGRLATFPSAGYAASRSLFPGRQVVTLTIPALLTSLLAAGDTLRGTVVDTAGHPLAAASVSVAELGLTLVTKADGTFRVVELPTGRYTLVVRRLGYAPIVATAAVPGPPLALVLRPSALHRSAVTVTATRSAISPLAAPLPTAELSGEQLRRAHEVSLAHALDQIPGIRTLSTGEQVGKPVIRGLTGPRVLVLDNGQRLEDYSWSDEDGPSVDARLAERVELIRGPASVLYGSDAIGGVINVIPKEVPDGRGRPAFMRGAAELYGATNNNEVGTVLRAEGASGRFGWSVTGIGRRADNFHTPPGNDSTPTGDIYNTAFHAINGEAVAGLHGDRRPVTLRYPTSGRPLGVLAGPPVAADIADGGSVFALETASLGRWTLLIGARGEARHLSADSNAALQVSAQTRNASALTANLGVVYRAAPGLAIAANAGRAFRAPTLFELFTNGPHLGEDRYEIGLPTARPEVSFNADLSVRWQSSRVRGELAVYRNQIGSYLYIAPTGSTDPGSGLAIYRYQQARAVLVGAEAGAEVVAAPVLTVRARLDAVRGTNEDTNEPLPLTPAPRADVEAEWHATGLRWAERVYLSAGLEAVTRQTRLGPFDEQTPAYQLLNLGAGLEQTVGGRLIYLDVRVRNATNTRYTDFLSRYKVFAFGEGRNVVVRLSTGL